MSLAFSPSWPYCDNCCADLPGAYYSDLIEGELLQLCSGRCVAELRRVWAPARRVWPWRHGLRAVTACLTVVVGLVLSR